jgi:D-aminoacyl-tRNA deacylase
MTILIVASTKDLAARNIAEKLMKLQNFKESEIVFDGNRLYKNGDILFTYINTDSIHTNNLDKHFKFDTIIFASRHRSESESPSFTVHTPGNFNDALLGGKPRELAIACPRIMRNVLIALKKARDELSLNYSVSLEATHHGPTEMNTPVMFVEIGSSEKQWKDDFAGEIVAKAMLSAIKETPTGRNAIGFGGGHYAPKHTETVLGSEIAIGHIMSKYAFENLNEETVKNMIERTENGCKIAVLDWKGIKGDDRKKLLNILKTLNIDILRV